MGAGWEACAVSGVLYANEIVYYAVVEYYTTALSLLNKLSRSFERINK